MKSTGVGPKTIKNRNQKIVLNLFRENQTLSITEVSKITKLSKTTVIKIFEHLVKNELIIFKTKGSSGLTGGKKPELYTLNGLFGYTITVHIKNDKIHLATTDINVKIEKNKVIPIKEDESLEKVTDIIAGFINEVTGSIKYKSRKLLGISIAAIGVTDPDKGEILTASRFPSWEYKAPFIKILQKKTSSDYIFYIDNQIRFITLTEQAMGKAKNINNFFVLSAGSEGVGGEVIINGILYRGNNYLAGEIGHTRIIPESKEVCHCGGRGCFENVVSYEKIIDRAKELYKADNSQNIDSITICDIFRGSNNGDPIAMKVMDEFAELYSIGLSNGCMMIDPELIIITGKIADAGDFFLNKLKEKMPEISLTHMNKNFNIQYATFNENGSLIGGAIHSINVYFEKHLFE